MVLASTGISLVCTAALSSLFPPQQLWMPTLCKQKPLKQGETNQKPPCTPPCSPSGPASPAKETHGREIPQTGEEAPRASSGCHLQGWAWALSRGQLLFHPFPTQEGKLKETILAPVKEVRNDAARSRRKYLLSMKCQRCPLQCCPSQSLSSLIMKGKLSPSSIF